MSLAIDSSRVGSEELRTHARLPGQWCGAERRLEHQRDKGSIPNPFHVCSAETEILHSVFRLYVRRDKPSSGKTQLTSVGPTVVCLPDLLRA